MGRRVQFALLAVMLAGAYPAQATTIQHYDSQADWLADVTGVTSFGFSGFADPNYDINYGSLTTNSVTFTGAGNYLAVRNYSPPFVYGPPAGGITVGLPVGTTAVAWLGGSFYGNPVTVVINGESYAGLGAGFVGFTSTTPITTLSIQSAGYPTLSSFSYGSATVPDESSTLLLLCIGLAIVVVVQHRLRGRPLERWQ